MLLKSKIISFSILIIVGCIPGRIQAQSQIVIRKMGETKAPITIVMNGNDVTVDGTPLEEYKNDSLIISRFFIRDYNALSDVYENMRLKNMARLPRLHHSFENLYGGGWKNRSVDELNKAFLGVMTEASDKGARIIVVTKGSPAEKAGLKVGDIISTVNNVAVKNADDLFLEIGKYNPNEKVKIGYIQDGKSKTSEIILAENKSSRTFGWKRDSDNDLLFNFESPEFDEFSFKFSQRPRLGATVQDTEDEKGVKLLEIEPESAATKAGLKEGDIIWELNGSAVTGTADIRKLLKEVKPGDSLTVRYRRENNELSTTIKFPKELKTLDL